VTTPLGSLKRGEEFRLADGREGTVDRPARPQVYRGSHVCAIVDAHPVGAEVMLPAETQVQRLCRVSPNYRRDPLKEPTP
jgi:hypothetical protein